MELFLKIGPNPGLQLAAYVLCEMKGKVNVELILCLIKHQDMKTSKRVEVQLQRFLTSH
jgi:hypothetical protein